MLLEISQNSDENTCASVSFLVKLQASSLIDLKPVASSRRCYLLSAEIVKKSPKNIEKLEYI